jgi:hypothetical protein
VGLPSATPTASGGLPHPFTLAGGASCRTWDDFLTLAAQRWKDLRGELSSGRLADYLRRIQRTDLVPALDKDRSPDEQLDQWLARLPVTRSSAPRLGVHPEELLVRASGGGGRTRQSLRITNLGYRLLRYTARVEPAGTSWIRFGPAHESRPIFPTEQTELPLELEIPDRLDRPLTAAIVLESNGGTRRLGVLIERAAQPVVPPEPAVMRPAVPQGADQRKRREWSLARLRPGARIAAAAVAAVALRALVALAGRLPVGGGGTSVAESRLPALVVVCAAVGALAGVLLARRPVEGNDRLAAGFAGGLFGLLTAAVLHAVILSIELPMRSWSSSLWAVGLLWAAIGAVISAIATAVLPHRSDTLEAAP